MADQMHEVAVDPDGRVILLASGPPDATKSLWLIALTPDGDVDTEFGSNGVALVPQGTRQLPSTQIEPALVRLADGRLIVSSVFEQSGGMCTLLAAFSSDGVHDPSFAPLGGDCSDFGYPVPSNQRLYWPISLVATDDGGAFLAAPSNFDTAPGWNAYVRITSAGALDPAFGTSGILFLDAGIRVAQQPDGKVLVGQGAALSASDFATGVLRLLPNGQPDASFGKDGRALVNWSSGEDVAQRILVDTVGRVVLVGTGPIDCSYCAARFLPNGTIDTSFNAAGSEPGIVRLFPNTTGTLALGGALRGGQIILSGRMSDAGQEQTGVGAVALDPGGNLDPRFGPPSRPGTFHLVPAAGQSDGGQVGEVVDAQGRLLLAGRQINMSPPAAARIVVVRLIDDRLLDDEFEDIAG